MLIIKILFVDVSFTISLTTYAVPADQLPLLEPISDVTFNSPALSKPKTFPPLSDAEFVNSVEVIVLVLDSFIDLSNSS